MDNSGATRENTLAIVDVGHGSAAVAVADGRVVIIDAGPKVGLLEYLSDQNIKEVDLLLLSHADQDHISGLICLLGARTINISRIRLNSDSRKDSEVWGDLLYELADNAKVGRTNVSFSITTGQTKEFSDERLGIEVLAPSIQLAGKGPGGQTRDGKKITAHMVSAVIRILRGGKPIAVLFGDLDQAGLHELVAEKLDATASLLVFPHHGGGAGTTDLSDFAKQLCELVQPQIVAFSIGRGRYRTPQPSVVKTIKDWNKDVRIACTQLSEYCAAEIKMADTAHLHPAFALGRERGHCCAGTLVFNLDNVNAVTPSGEAHKSFIRKSAPTALCS